MLISVGSGLRSTTIAFSFSWHADGPMKLPTRSQRPVMSSSSSGMPRLSSTGKTAWGQTPHSPMNNTHKLRLIFAPDWNGRATSAGCGR